MHMDFTEDVDSYTISIFSNTKKQEDVTMECHYELKEGCLTISMPKELDHHSAEQLRMEADLLIDSYRVRNLVFDFSGTEFMDSSGIGVLIGRCRNMSYCGGSVKAQHMNDRIQKIFRISGLHKLMETEAVKYE